MKISTTVAGVVFAAGILTASAPALADMPADDFLNPQDPGQRLSFMTLFGPGFRAVYDHRYELEEDVTELRTQIIGDAVVPYSEIGAHVDLRMFLFSVGASVGYHNEWHLLQFQPNYNQQFAGYSWGLDNAGQRQLLVGPNESGNFVNVGTGQAENQFGFNDLTRDARRVKDQNADVQTGKWPFYEGRVQFLWPAQNFMGVSTAAMRYDDRPDVSYDWFNATVLNGGWHLRWETYAFFRHREYGFIGPALRILNVPRNRLQAPIAQPTGDFGPLQTAPRGSACQKEVATLTDGTAAGVPCEEVRETDFAYGIVGGFNPGWVGTSDVFLTRIYTTFGLDDDLFGTHIFGMPISILFAYQVDIAL